MDSTDEPAEKRPKPAAAATEVSDVVCVENDVRCRYFVQRKKRYCKMTVGKGKLYCGEHEVHADSGTQQQDVPGSGRIPCPLDPKHSISAAKLDKHLKICNAKPKELPEYIEPGINAESDGEGCDLVNEEKDLKLSDVPLEELESLVKKIEDIFEVTQIGVIEEMMLEHEACKEELSNETYGPQTLKHLVQSASLLAILEREKFFRQDTAFVEFGAGKGQVAFWLATILQKSGLSNVKVFLVDKASHRHKKDNKIEDREIIQRIRADIGDLVLRKLDVLKGSRNVVGVGKHLCGGATDLALRCLIRANKDKTGDDQLQSEGFLFALCCHHRCDWKTYAGKKFLLEKGIGRKEFNLIVKMVSWAVCGSGTSRERRKNETTDDGDGIKYGLTRTRREEIGRRCKRVLDWGRIQHLNQNGFAAGLKFYAKSEITLENVCLVGHVK
ncbi:tRNA:m(4)X modification enzyme TRM13 homolog [Ochlerotatus camptorhynchus]|uniref:tRNA:m(4)X modification enzyme TRM13 homolog n=1 Tax=Ochlerotatus camptorhynchus TaxID=644619 RepID=UPI0031E2C038